MTDQVRGDDADDHAPKPTAGDHPASATPPKSKSRSKSKSSDSDGTLRDEQGRKVAVPVDELTTENDEGAG